MPSRVDKLEYREEVELLDVSRKRARPPQPASSGRLLTSEHVHKVNHWGLKARSQASKGVCGQHMQCGSTTTGRIGPVACIWRRQCTRHTTMQSILGDPRSCITRGCGRAARRRQRARIWPRRGGGLGFFQHLAAVPPSAKAARKATGGRRILLR